KSVFSYPTLQIGPWRAISGAETGFQLAPFRYKSVLGPVHIDRTGSKSHDRGPIVPRARVGSDRRVAGRLPPLPDCHADRLLGQWNRDPFARVSNGRPYRYERPPGGGPRSGRSPSAAAVPAVRRAGSPERRRRTRHELYRRVPVGRAAGTDKNGCPLNTIDRV